MTAEEWIRLVFSFLGGGLIVTVLSWVKTTISERVSRKVDLLNHQLRILYGPLCFFSEQNEGLSNVGSRIDEAYRTEYCDKSWNDDEGTQRALDSQTLKTIELENKYGRIIRENNEKMVELLRSNYFLIDPGDTQMFQQFVLDWLRHKTETSDDRVETPRPIYKHLGHITIFSPDVTKRIKERFREKSAELADLRRLPSWWFFWARGRTVVPVFYILHLLQQE